MHVFIDFLELNKAIIDEAIKISLIFENKQTNSKSNTIIKLA